VFETICSDWQASATMMDVPTFLAHPLAPMLLMTLLGIAVSGGMFVVPLYAFLTTFVEKSQTARTIAANNIVNSGAMVVGALFAGLLSLIGLAVVKQLLVVAVCCLLPAWFGYVLVKAERAAATA
jgi:MFS family permease